MKIIDAHMHLPENYGSLEEKKKALLEEMKRNSVSKAVIISDSEMESSIGNTEECVQLFSDCDNIAVIGGISPFISFDDRLADAEKMVIENKLAGFKIYCGHEPVYLNDSSLDKVYRMAQKYNIPVLFHSGWNDPQYSSPEIIKKTAAAYPAVKLVCCHCCYPDLPLCFETLAENGNVFFDISSTADDPKIISHIKSAIEKAVNTFPERFIFGSDFGSCDQKAHIDLCRSLDISENALRKIFYENAEEIYRL